MTDRTLEEKQEYLRKEVIEKNYNPEDFLAYFQNLKEEQELDLDYVHYDDLIKVLILDILFLQVVNDFQISFNSGERYTIVPNNIKKEGQSPNLSVNNNEDNNKIQNLIGLNEDNEIDEMLMCQKIEKSPLNAFKNLTLKVCNPKIIKGSFLQSNYAIYTIKCEEINSEVSRRFKDFEWLRYEFKHMFPTSFV